MWEKRKNIKKCIVKKNITYIQKNIYLGTKKSIFGANIFGRKKYFLDGDKYFFYTFWKPSWLGFRNLYLITISFPILYPVYFGHLKNRTLIINFSGFFNRKLKRPHPPIYPTHQRLYFGILKKYTTTNIFLKTTTTTLHNIYIII